ncbi:hypothetical protein [Gymnodinialimonas hymeniacidonis]|uniref:hypothetical protein n=1 Tax=Gymnodinialimonas hymeniacidonis TaxID=3126508 RepID=UPI0034C6ADFE
MSIGNLFQTFIDEELGAITTDWTALTGLAVGFALATAALFTDINGMLAGNMNEELADGDIADDWPHYVTDHFEPLLASGYLSVGQAAYLHSEAFDMMNHEVITRLDAGIAALENGTITAPELAELVSIASIAHQRNLVPDTLLNEHFGFDNDTTPYMTADSAPDAGDAPYSGPSCTQYGNNCGDDVANNGTSG